MIGLAWLVMAYREALRRSEARAEWCIGEGCYTCSKNAKRDILNALEYRVK
jgi:hypothetical protein